jgi:hypothetical protein
MYETAVCTTVAASEGALTVEVAVLAASQPDAVTLTWWLVPTDVAVSGIYSTGAGNTTVSMTGIAGRGLYSAPVPLPSAGSATLEYVCQATWKANGEALYVPIEGAQSVVVV